LINKNISTSKNVMKSVLNPIAVPQLTGMQGVHSNIGPQNRCVEIHCKAVEN
jgi:hypothetical protein